MLWNLEELTEDALKSYLDAQLNGELSVYTAWGFDTPTFPCVVVHASATAPISTPAEWHDARSLVVQLAVMSEAAPEVDANGQTIKDARARNVTARSKVLDAICKTGLVDLLNARGIDGVAFDMAQVTTTSRDVSDRRLATTITMEVIAEPVTGSA